jgi:putative FmdB family regulatory protein
MPTYEYQCSECGHRMEAFQSIKARPLRKCPKCGRSNLTRLISAGAGVIFRGSGFYQTDYRSESYRKGAEAEKKAAGDNTKDADDKTKLPKNKGKRAAN